jgi:uncharacterized protein (TIGR03083 family)
MSEPGSPPDLAWLYRDTRERLSDLISELDPVAYGTDVPACPGWAVRDVLAHLTAIPEDAIAGRLVGLPDEEFTADQVSRFAGVPVAEMLTRWAACAPQFEQVIQAREIWPAVIDVASHEQDIRGALGLAGARQCAAISQVAPILASRLDLPLPVKIVTERGEYTVGAAGGEPALTLSTSEYDLFRWRMGRRSQAQLAAMNWSGDPSAILAMLTVFGPATSDIVE